VRGPADALVTIVEVLDFECPFCKQVAPTVKQVEEAYRGRVRLVFKHNPIGMHRDAVPAAKLAEEARAEGGDVRFWEARDKLLELPSLDRASLEAAAIALKLDAAKVKAALGDGRHIERMRRDQNLLNPLGARGTPTFFVNGRKLVGAQPLEAFKAVVDEELAKAQELVNRGAKPSEVYARIVENGARAQVMVAAPPAKPMDANVALRPDDPASGKKDAPVTVVEFSDFQCPFCFRAVQPVKDVEQAFGKDVRIVWKHMPLPFHPNAMPAAIAAEAAREQGKFWQMHDKLFANQQALSDTVYEQYAKELGLDLARFRAALRAPETRKRIEQDAAAAAAAGVTGTPSFIVNGELVVGSTGLRDAVQRQLDKVKLAAR
jgi:protein-disulfide isomerase